MPEAAEVQTVATQLGEWLPATVTAARLHGGRAWRRGGHPEALVGATWHRAHRRGKWLAVAGDGPGVGIHLRMTGRLLLGDPDADYAPHTATSWWLDTPQGAARLDFIDPRTFGECVLRAANEALGTDVADVADGVTGAALATQAATSRAAIKTILADQRRCVQGIGNYLADELCHRAQVCPAQPAAQLNADDWDRLAAVMPGCVGEFTAARGTSLADETWRDLYGVVGDGAALLRVHARTQCADCGNVVAKTRLAGRSSYWCEACCAR